MNTITTTTTGIVPACETCNGQPSAYWPRYTCRPACDTCIDRLLDEREADARETRDDLNDYDREPTGWTADEMTDMDAHLDALVCTHCGLKPDLTDRQWDRDDGPACRGCDGHGLTQRGEYESRPTGPLPSEFSRFLDTRWSDGTVTRGDFPLGLDTDSGEEIPF